MAGSKGKTPHSGARGPARKDVTIKNKKRRAAKRARIAASPKAIARATMRAVRAQNKRDAASHKRAVKANKPVEVQAITAPVS